MAPAVPFQPEGQPEIRLCRLICTSCTDFDRFQKLSLGFDLSRVHGVDVSSSGLRFCMAQACLNDRGMDLISDEERRQAVAQIVPTKP